MAMGQQEKKLAKEKRLYCFEVVVELKEDEDTPELMQKIGKQLEPLKTTEDQQKRYLFIHGMWRM